MAGRSGRCALLLALGLLLSGASTASAQTYRWEDEEGRIHFTDDPSDIPSRYRKQLEQVELPEPTYTPPAAPRATPAAADGSLVQGVAEALRQRSPDLPASQRQALATAIVDRLFLLLAGAVIHTLATLALFGHAVANGRALWAAGNLLLFFIPPIYALWVLETDALKKGLILVAWATGPAAGVALHWTLAGIGA